MNLTLLASWSRLGLIALAMGCSEPAFVPTEPGEDASSSDDDEPTDDARVTPSRTDAGESRPMSRPVGDPDAVRQGRDAQAGAPSRDAGKVGDAGDAGSAAMREEDAGPVLITSQPGRDGSCILSGTYSVRMKMDVSWEGRRVGPIPLVRSGSGAATVYARINIDGTTTAMLSRVALCGADFPEFEAGDPTFISERYGFYIPDAVWESNDMPRWDVLWERDCEVARAGCRLSGLELDATLGAKLLADGAGMLMSLDHDGDGYEGVTIRARTPEESGMKYQRVPLSFSTNARAESLFSALVVGAQFDAVLSGCDSFEGELARPRIEIRALGCLVRATETADETPCSTEQERFLVDNVPTVVAQSATFEGRRIREEASCAAVRSVWTSDER